MYAIIRDGGHQFRVEPGDSILIERVGLSAGEALTFKEVLFAGGKVGVPLVEGATVEAVVERPVKARKIYIVKYKRRKNYRRRTGHRQQLTRVRIKTINA
ncbi:MAG: 50S ribosomal protein L21 [Planctomycetes bacterium]|nr:50S ribosomal protein L21 [Planctomycetota bacterium]